MLLGTGTEISRRIVWQHPWALKSARIIWEMKNVNGENNIMNQIRRPLVGRSVSEQPSEVPRSTAYYPPLYPSLGIALWSP